MKFSTREENHKFCQKNWNFCESDKNKILLKIKKGLKITKIIRLINEDGHVEGERVEENENERE